MGGRLILIVGPSGAGKDTLITAAREALADDPRFVFVRRIVTRPADARVEDHDSMTSEAFAAAAERGEFALTWHAHGLDYGLPATLDVEIATGHLAIANASRRMVEPALARYPGATIILIDAPAEIRARRLAARGRETLPQVEERLAREADLPASVSAIRIDNSGPLDAALAQLLGALRTLA